MKRSRWGWLGCLVWLCVMAVPKGYADDVAEINTLLDQIQESYPKNDVQAISQNLSDFFIAVLDLPQQPDKALVLDKFKMLKALSKNIGEIQHHEFVQRDIWVQEQTALIRVSMLDQRSDGKTRMDKGVRLAVREGEQWRMLLAFPLFFEAKTLVVSPAPGSQAETMGLRAGDIITHYAGEPIEYSAQLIAAVDRESSQPRDRSIPVRVLRGKEEMALTARPGKLGVRIDTRLFPTDGARLIGLDEPHPLKEPVRTIREASRDKNVNQALAEACPDGFITLASQVIGPSNARQEIERIFEEQSKILRFETMKCEGIQALVKGNIAVVAVRGSFETLQDQVQKYVSLHLYVGQNSRWFFVADLPLLNVDIGSCDSFFD